MPRLIDADKLRLSAIEITHNSEFAFDNCFPYWQFSKAIREAPTVEAITIEWLERKTKEMMIVWKTADRLEDSWKAGDIMDAIELITDLWEKENEQERINPKL